MRLSKGSSLQGQSVLHSDTVYMWVLLTPLSVQYFFFFFSGLEINTCYYPTYNVLWRINAGVTNFDVKFLKGL